MLEEQLNLSKVQKLSASSEKFAYQTDLFDEVELEQAIADIDALLPDELLTEAAVAAKKYAPCFSVNVSFCVDT